MTTQESIAIDMMRRLLDHVLVPDMRSAVEDMQRQHIVSDLVNVCGVVLLRTAARLHAAKGHPSGDFLSLAESERWRAQAEFDAQQGGGDC